MWETNKTNQITMEIGSYNLTVLRISETHWNQARQKTKYSGEMLLYSGNEEENATNTQGVALMPSKEARKPLIGWESHAYTIIKASFKTEKEATTISVIQYYEPTNHSNDDIKHQFHERLQSIITKCPANDLTILMGNLNSKVGMDNNSYENIIG